VGGGGHAARILQCGDRVRLVGLDCDDEAIQEARERLGGFGGRKRLIRANFADLGSLDVEKADGVVFDLGASSHQFDTAARGFSFAQEAALDMRFDRRLKRTAADLVAETDEQGLERILREYGDEHRARRIAAEMVRARKVSPIRTTKQLAALVERVVGRKPGEKIEPATRTFMALRIALNNEFERLQAGLDAARSLLLSGGRLAVISFHSGEDRIVKNFFRTESRDCLCPPQVIQCQCGHRRSLQVLTKKPVTPSDAETRRNPRARSAKLRVAEKI
jgi:16S rRNA (cytosine1402-N4)-methyltransferase